jgi:hypothetical protein
MTSTDCTKLAHEVKFPQQISLDRSEIFRGKFDGIFL